MEGVVELSGLHAPPVLGGYVCWGFHVRGGEPLAKVAVPNVNVEPSVKLDLVQPCFFGVSLERALVPQSAIGTPAFETPTQSCPNEWTWRVCSGMVGQ